jgi:uncharacterized membrane protein YcaP (DUF421 family)
VLGARALTRLTTADLVVLLVAGAIAGRCVLGPSPTLAGGVVALVVVLVLRLATGAVRRTGAGRALVVNAPLLLVAGGEPVEEHLRRARIGAPDLAVALRTAGVASIAEVACAVLEPTGAISVTRWDPARPLDPALFAGVVGIDRVPAACFRA